MDNHQEAALDIVLNYHERTKHHPNRYARSLGYMDWPNQPDPFRTFSETEKINLGHPKLRQKPTYDQLFSENPAVQPLNTELIARLFYHSLALSAWKQAPGTQPWSLRINPSSGALYPTEGYLICGNIPGLIESPGVYHYAPYHHQLERRGSFSLQEWQRLKAGFPNPCLLIGLSSIHWRESWKYGERAYRYCQHDVGHAIGALAFCCRTLGWNLRLLQNTPAEFLDSIMGTHLQSGMDAEQADCLLIAAPEKVESSLIHGLSPEEWQSRLPKVIFYGKVNQLSQNHHPWPVIDDVAGVVRGDAVRLLPSEDTSGGNMTLEERLVRDQPAEQIIRQRRSARKMDGVRSLGQLDFYQMMARQLPNQFPFRALSWSPQVSLVLFVHRVEDLEPGLYILIRDSAHEIDLRRILREDFAWEKPSNCPSVLPFYRLVAEDNRKSSRIISCHQEIASDGVFLIGMLVRFEGSLLEAGAGFYPHLFWETALIGQILYLEAEAAGLRGTGIGCFFDDLVHEMLGIKGRKWQNLYHFTVGGAVEDHRIRTIPPYAYLDVRKTGAFRDHDINS